MNCLFFSFIYSFYLGKVNAVPVCNSNQILTNENGYVRCTCADGFFGKDCSRRKFNYLLAMIHSKIQVDWLHYKITKTSYFFIIQSQPLLIQLTNAETIVSKFCYKILLYHKNFYKLLFFTILKPVNFKPASIPEIKIEIIDILPKTY